MNSFVLMFLSFVFLVAGTILAAKIYDNISDDFLSFKAFLVVGAFCVLIYLAALLLAIMAYLER